MSTKLFEIECPLFRTEDHVEPALCQVLREFSAMPEGISAKKQTRLIPEPGLGYRSQMSKIIYRVDKRHPLDWVKTNAGRLVQQIVFHKVDFTFSVETADRAGYIYKINDHLYEGSYSPTHANGKRKKFNVYAETHDQCETKLAEMIAQKKAEIAQEKAKQKEGDS